MLLLAEMRRAPPPGLRHYPHHHFTSKIGHLISLKVRLLDERPKCGTAPSRHVAAATTPPIIVVGTPVASAAMVRWPADDMTSVLCRAGMVVVD